MKTSTYLKSGLATLSVAALIALSGCGGSSGTSSISGTVQASIIKGVKVCIKDNNTSCATTDANGRFTIAGFAPPQTLEIKVGNTYLSKRIQVNSTTVAITPKLIAKAEGNESLAPYIGLLLHKAAGDENLTRELCDLSGVTSIDINGTAADDNGTLIDGLKDILRNSNRITIITPDRNDTITETDVIEYETAYPEMTSDQVNFAGAASIGDLATFSYDTDTHSISYHVQGSAFGDVNGTKQLTNLFNNIIFTDSNNNFYFFSGSMGVAMVDLNESDTNDTKTPIIGLQTPPSTDTSLIINKTFNYIEFNSTGSPILCDNNVPPNCVPNFKIIRVYATSSNAQDGNWTTDEFNLSSGNFEVNYTSGTWELNGTHLDINDSNVTVAHAIIRPPVGTGRAGFLVDIEGNITERGFGIGVEAKELNISEIEGTYYFTSISLRDRNASFGCVTISDDNDSNISTGIFTVSKECNGSIVNGTLKLNPYIDDLNITVPGIVEVNDSGDISYAFIDPVSGYFIEIDPNPTDPGLTIGSNKPLQ